MHYTNIWGAAPQAPCAPEFINQNNKTMKNNRFLGWSIVIALLVIAIFCEYKVGIPLVNAFLDVALTVAVFLVGYNDTQKKSKSQQGQIQELQNRIKQLEEEQPNPQQNTLWQYAIKK